MTTVYIVPIRYWEEPEPETAELLEIGVDGFAYVYHPGYGHNVYVEEIWQTYEQAKAVIKERHEAYLANEEAELDALMEKLRKQGYFGATE